MTAAASFSIRLICLTALLGASQTEPRAETVFTGEILDAQAGEPVEARIYIQRLRDSRWLFVQSASDDGSAVPYAEEWVPMAQSVERHTTLSAHPFKTVLEPGDYEITIERGKEYHPHTERITVADTPVHRVFRLKRWINLAERGWYSGETHVHRRFSELPNVMLAEDLNVAFPVTFWTTQAYRAPNLLPSTLRRQGPSPFGNREDRGAQPIAVDPTHLIYPRNTEYEVFSVDGSAHVLGAVFILNHQSRFETGMPPVGPIVEQARREGALLDLDKHSWPWSMMLVPVAKIDLYELSNNSVWRTEFGFRRPSVAPAPYMKVERHPEGGLTERGWLHYGLENYYTLLNCGFPLQPTAGTASGVHPVPLGYSRVYVHTGEAFSGSAWLDGLRRGRSFVTTGPMLFAKVEEQLPGHVFDSEPGDRLLVRGQSLSAQPLESLEIVQHGKILHRVAVENQKTAEGAYQTSFEEEIEVPESSTWIAVRCFEKNGPQRIRFAHTAPWRLEIPGAPPRPRKEETDFLIGRIEDELARHENVLKPEALTEFEKALRIYREIAQRATEAP